MSGMSRKILGQSPAVRAMLELIQKVAPTKTNILVIGESGTGKELVARMIHDSGPLKDKPFICVNCGAIPEALIESEMFGHKRGSFTGAIQDKPGMFQIADGGTLFLDEVGELPMSTQVKLLRAIQERIIRRVGGTEDIRIDVRIIAATNRNLESAVAQGAFREDLYYRLNVIQIKTPPLKDRKGDIQLLAEQFLQRVAAKFNKKVEGFDPDVLEAFESHGWPGNVRELENTIERAVTLEPGDWITFSSLPHQFVQKVGKAVACIDGDASAPGSPAADIVFPGPDFSSGPLDLDKILGDLERIYINAALAQAGGVKKKAAELLGITFRSIRYRLKKLGVDGAEDAEELD